MTKATIATIPRERRQAYGDAANTMGDLRALMTAIQQTCENRAILGREGRTGALKGADRLLAGVVRRLCVTLAKREEEARDKVDVLSAVQQLYGAGDGVLMVAMIDAAIGLETEAWLSSSTRH